MLPWAETICSLRAEWKFDDAALLTEDMPPLLLFMATMGTGGSFCSSTD